MKFYWKQFRALNRDIRLYMLYWCMIGFAYFGVEGVLMNIYLVRLGYGPEFIGRLMASGQLVWALFAIPAGWIGGRYGVRQAMVGGMAILAAATGLMLAAESLPQGGQTGGLVAAWMLSWVGAALATVNAPPYLMAVTDGENRGVAFATQQAVMAAAGFAGSVAAGVLPGMLARLQNVSLAEPGPYRLALTLAPAAYLLAAAVFQRAQPAETAAPSTAQADKSRLPLAVFAFAGLVVFFQAFGEGLVRPFFNLYLDLGLEVPVARIGSLLGLSSLLMILLSLVTPAVLRYWGTRGTLRLTTLGFVGFSLLLAWLQQWTAAAILYVSISSMLTLMATARGIYVQELVQPQWRTSISAVSTVGLALGWAFSAWLGGGMIASGGFTPLFIAGAAAALLGAGLLFARVRRVAGDPAASSSQAKAVMPVTGKTEEV